MKTMIFLFGLFLSISTFAQEVGSSRIPADVTKAFEDKYQGAELDEWEFSDESGFYQAEFEMDRKEYEAYFTSDGEWVYTERDIKKSDLPQAVLDAIQNSEYSDWEIDDVEEHDTAANGLIYEIELEKRGQNNIYMYFSPEGEQIKK